MTKKKKITVKGEDLILDYLGRMSISKSLLIHLSYLKNRALFFFFIRAVFSSISFHLPLHCCVLAASSPPSTAAGKVPPLPDGSASVTAMHSSSSSEDVSSKMRIIKLRSMADDSTVGGQNSQCFPNMTGRLPGLTCGAEHS
ncbi:co-factor for nitrate [Striga asiatica]|uniref:Co-factor for nitrate n=1 Tax=Striga asiatica TaxID=4170 RepID=A0A5A7P813_STRAF|nr:co-factor for nitrate [Striga asiatica]